jgi:hypothetical protein
MHRFHLDTSIRPLEPTCLKASVERSRAWVRQTLECHYCRPLAIAHSPFERRTSAAESMSEGKSVES